MDISLQLDKHSAIPLYQQIYRQLRPLILNGALPAGSRLPATRRLAAVHSIARVTVLQAYEQLEVEGFVEGRTGAGTDGLAYVCENHVCHQPVADEESLLARLLGRSV